MALKGAILSVAGKGKILWEWDRRQPCGDGAPKGCVGEWGICCVGDATLGAGGTWGRPSIARGPVRQGGASS